MNRVLFAVLAVLAAACATARPAAEITNLPVTAETLRIEEREQSMSALTAVAIVRVANDGANPVTATSARFAVVSEGKVVNEGTVQLSEFIPGGGSATVEVPARFVFADTEKELAALIDRKEPIAYAVRGFIDLDEGQVEFAKATATRAPRMPRLKLANLDASASPSTGISVAATIDLENPNTFPLLLVDSRWKLSVAGAPAGEGVLERKSPKPASHTLYPIEVALDPAAVKARKELQGATVPYALEAEIDLGVAKVRLEETGEAKLLRAGD